MNCYSAVQTNVVTPHPWSVRHVREALKTCYRLYKSPHDIFPCFVLTHIVPTITSQNCHPSWNYSSPSTLNCWVLSGSLTEKISASGDIGDQINSYKPFRMHHHIPKTRVLQLMSLKCNYFFNQTNIDNFTIKHA